MAKQQEIQEQVKWFREKYALEDFKLEPELPLSLDAKVLQQRALTTTKTKSPLWWKKFAPMTAAFILVAAVGVYSGGFAAAEKAAAAPQMAAFTAEEMPQAAAFSPRVIEQSVEIKTHLVSSDSKKVLRELYPGVKFYSLSLTGDFWTIIHLVGVDGESAVAVRADEAEIVEEEYAYVVRDISSGKELRFDSLTLKKMN